jgi:hypothetical protein
VVEVVAGINTGFGNNETTLFNRNSAIVIPELRPIGIVNYLQFTGALSGICT